jgi:uncharacterized SAM-binding protein YcdF (DUF218 family)
MKVREWLGIALAMAGALVLPTRAFAAGRAIVVFGTHFRADGRPGQGVERRLERTLSLANAMPDAKIIVSGGAVANRYAEGPGMARWLIAHGVPAERILVEDKSRYTVQNALFTAPLIRSAGVDRVTLVTERFHMRRATLDLRSALRMKGAADVAVEPSPAPDGLEGRARTSRMVRESMAIVRDAAALRVLP